MPKWKQWLRDFIIALSIGNLTYIRNWNELLTYTKEQAFFFRRPPSLQQSLATAVNVITLGLVIFLGIRLLRRIHKGSRWLLIPASLLIIPPGYSIWVVLIANLALWAPRYNPEWFLPGLTSILVVTALVILLSVIGIAVRWPAETLTFASSVAITFAPLMLVEAGGVVYHRITDTPSVFESPPLATKVQKEGAQTILWLLIDELDYRLLFVDRPKDIQLPEFDRFRAEAINAEQATPPAKDTRESVPSLLSGKRFVATETEAPALFWGLPPGSTTRLRITPEQSIFSSARAAGLNTSVVGWYLPYCRIYAPVLSACTWYDASTRIVVDNQSFSKDLMIQRRAPFETKLFSPFTHSVLDYHRLELIPKMHGDIARILSQPSPGFVYIHHMATHTPYVYDRLTGGFTKRNDPVGGYVDSLVWADSVLRDIRQTMEKAGTWNNAVVLVTADHSFRNAEKLDGKRDFRIPWMLKLPGQQRPEAYTAPLRTIITKKLLESIMAGYVRTIEQARTWIDENERRVAEDADRP